MLQIRTDLLTAEERIEAMHARASEMRYEAARRRSRFAVISASVVSLAVILNLAFIMPATMERFTSPGGIGDLKGSILSGSPVIGYVVIGIVAFLLGAAVTLLCFRTRTLHGPSSDMPPGMPPEIRRNKLDE